MSNLNDLAQFMQNVIDLGPTADYTSQTLEFEKSSAKLRFDGDYKIYRVFKIFWVIPWRIDLTVEEAKAFARHYENKS